MRAFDLIPLYRATVGFDQIADLMDRVLTDNVMTQTYPPYNIEKTADDAWRISIAAAGFAEDDIELVLRLYCALRHLLEIHITHRGWCFSSSGNTLGYPANRADQCTWWLRSRILKSRATNTESSNSTECGRY